jgi:hypothetical protein
LRPSSLVICNSERKKKLVCGLISSRARPLAVIAGAMAMPLEPRGSSSFAAAVTAAGEHGLPGTADGAAGRTSPPPA